MTEHMPDDVDPVGRDLRAYTDELRPAHAMVRNTRGEWVLLRHADVVAAALDAETFSSDVSRYLQVPNGLDGAAHRAARESLDQFFTAEALAEFEPVFRSLAKSLVAALPTDTAVNAVDEIGAQFAVRAQSGWLGWPTELEPRLLAWVAANHAASRSGDQQRTAEVAAEFTAIIESVLRPRQAAGDAAPDDVTTHVMRTQVAGRPFTDEELISILRNWTGGDLGSIALCVGVLCAYLADHPDLQDHLATGVSEQEFNAVIDEIIRIDDPFPSNRRKTTCPVHIAGTDLAEGAVVKLHWMAANRDTTVFAYPDRFDPVTNAEHNIVYGIGPHVCPGRGLATMELRILLQELLSQRQIQRASGQEWEREVTPVGGYHRVPVILALR